jgi:hypothetical protein
MLIPPMLDAFLAVLMPTNGQNAVLEWALADYAYPLAVVLA